MNVVIYPMGGLQHASSRYRAWLIAKGSPYFYMGTHLWDSWEGADVAFFQRINTDEYQRLAKRNRNVGNFVVFDCTDFYWRTEGIGKPISEGDRAMAKLAHLLTACNEDDVERLRETFDKPACVLPNPQRLRSVKSVKKHRPTSHPVLAWMGYGHNIDRLKSIWPILKRLAKDVAFEVLIITNIALPREFCLDKNHLVVHVPWELSKLNETLLRADVMVNPQLSCPDGKYYKDDNKTVTAWMHGLPCVSFDTVSDWEEDLKALLTDWELRRDEGSRAREKARERDVSVVAPKWLDILSEVLTPYEF